VRTVAAYGLSHDMVSLYTRAQEGPREKLRKRAVIDGAAFGFGQGMFVFLCARPSFPPDLCPMYQARMHARIHTALKLPCLNVARSIWL
jgi:hypothetical protein